MSLVRVRYLEDGKQVEEVCTLVDGEGGRSVQIPGQILLEDDFGLWYLDENNLISMNPATEAEQSRHVWRT